MDHDPVIDTPRLRLRPFGLADAPRVRELANDPRIAAVTTNIPYPYPAGLAEQWIGDHERMRQSGQAFHFAIDLRAQELLIGSISVESIAGGKGTVGYWLGVDYWGQGVMTEACRALRDFAFGSLGLKRLHAMHLLRNPASGRVLLKSGFVRRGREQRELRGRQETVVLYDAAAVK